ncbi:MAG: O-antigen ligase family protein [Microthrixaceae bacterium]
MALLLEVGTALLLQEVRIFGLVHAAAILLIGMYAVLRRNLAMLICILAYITGSEVMWRQVRAPIFYLAAPYLFIILSSFAVLFVLKHIGKDGKIALLYAAVMLPGMAITVGTTGAGAREIIAFALSGPLALAAFVMFTSQVRIAPWLYRRVLWVTLISSVGPLTIAVADVRSELAAAGRINFSSQSNFATSGGFGPVQVSSALSLGIMAAILLIISEREKVPKIIASFLAIILGVQVLLTFSRGGSFAVGIAMTALAVVQARNRRIRNSILGVSAVALALAYFLIFPWLENFTDGAFEARFSNTQSSRTDLAANDAEIFADNFVFGVGPGMTKYQRLGYAICQIRSDQCVDEASSHTEFTRMLGEHGIPGIISIVLLVMLAVSAAKRAGPGRAFAIAWVAWAVAQMFYANLRIVAVPFAFGLAFLRLTEEINPTPERDEGSLEKHPDGTMPDPKLLVAAAPSSRSRSLKLPRGSSINKLPEARTEPIPAAQTAPIRTTQEGQGLHHVTPPPYSGEAQTNPFV